MSAGSESISCAIKWLICQGYVLTAMKETFYSPDFCSYCACASSYNAIVLMDRVDFARLWETFGSRSIFLAHDNAGNKFDKHLISIDFTSSR